MTLRLDRVHPTMPATPTDVKTHMQTAIKRQRTSHFFKDRIACSLLLEKLHVRVEKVTLGDVDALETGE